MDMFGSAEVEQRSSFLSSHRWTGRSTFLPDSPISTCSPRQPGSPTCRSRSRSTKSRLGKAMRVTALTALVTSAVPCEAAGLADNVTGISGTWSSGSGAVSTGLGFFNPLSYQFTIPPAGGISYSFTDDGYWEQAKYIFANDPTHNRCVNATLIWQHGTYTFNSNGSLSLTPFAPDGHVLLIDMCGGQTASENYINQFELIPEWYIRLESNSGFGDSTSAYYLQMFEDGGKGQIGKKMAPLYLQARPPNMLPTQQLHETVLNS